MKTINPYRLFVGSFIPNWLMCRREVSQGAKLAYARLCQYADKDTGIAWPSRDVLAAECGVSERQMGDYLAELAKFKLIQSIRTGMGATNRYVFLEHEWFGTSDQERNNSSYQERQYSSDQDRNNSSDPLYKERRESSEKNQEKRKPPLNPPRGKGLVLEVLELPDCLESHREAIGDWLEYKIEKRKRYTAKGLKALLSKLATMENPTSAIRWSMSANYDGVYAEPSQKPKSKETFEEKARRLGLA